MITKADAVKNNAMAKIITLAESCERKLNLVEVIENHVTAECLSTFNTLNEER